MRVLNPRSPAVGFAVCLLIGMALSVIDRTDANWDLQNYHLYAPYAALHGRLGMDWFAAGFQGYLNPTEDIPYYIVKMVWFPNHPVVVAALAGLPFGFLVFVTVNVALAVLPGPGVAVLAAILGLTGATILSEVGTTYDDILTADLVLSAVWLALGHAGWRGLALAGFLLGSAVGLKFTSAIYVPGFALLCLWRNPTQVLRHGIIVMLFAAGGFIAVWGWWGWQLWVNFGNPFFPMLGGLFPRSTVSVMSFHDPRFMPRNLLQWLFYPFYWVQGRSFIVSEEPLRDARFALVYLALGARLGNVVFKRCENLSREISALMMFFAVTYLCWIIGFSILRYALALEAISGIVIFAALSGLVDRRTYLTVIGAITIFSLVFTKPMGWGRIGYGKLLVEAPLPMMDANSVVLEAGAPIGFIVPYLKAPSAAFLSLAFMQPGSKEFDIVQKRLAAGDDTELLTDADAAELATDKVRLMALGRTFDARDCVPIKSPVQKMIKLCALTPLH